MEVISLIVISAIFVFALPWIAKFSTCIGAIIAAAFYEWYKQIVETWKEFLQFIGVWK